MKRIFLTLVPIIIFFIFIGCNKDSGGTTTDPFNSGTGGTTGGTTGSVTFQVQIVHDQQGTNYFEFSPSTSVTITKITANCAQAGINNEEVQGDETTLYDQTSPADVPITGVTLQTGQTWSFVIVGKIGGSTGEAYSSNVSHTVQ